MLHRLALNIQMAIGTACLDYIAIEFIGDINYQEDRICQSVMEGVLQVYNTGKCKMCDLTLKELCQCAARMIIENPVEFRQDCIANTKVRYGE